MRRALGLVAAVLGLATTAVSAATLTVFTTDAANNVRALFLPGETILLKVTGDSQGGTDIGIEGRLFWNGALTTTVVSPPGCNGSFAFPCTTVSQGDWLPVKGSLFPSDGSAFAFNQLSPPEDGPQPATNPIDTSVITLVATNAGVTSVTWGGTILDFFGIYVYNYGYPISVPTGHSFSIIPEPGTAALVGLGLVGIALGRRRRV